MRAGPRLYVEIPGLGIESNDFKVSAHVISVQSHNPADVF